MSRTLITSRDPKGPNYGYPERYKNPKPLARQIGVLAKIFGLSLGCTIDFVEKILPTLTLSEGAEGWFAIPSIDALAARSFPWATDSKERLCAATNLILAKIGESREFYNYREGRLTPDRFRLNARTALALEVLAEQQKGDIWIVGGSFDKRHAGRSAYRAREVFVGPEFGGYTVAVGSMLITHPERLASYKDRGMNIPGDEFDRDGVGSFDCAPYFYYDGGVKFSTAWASISNAKFGSISLFLPQ